MKIKNLYFIFLCLLLVTPLGAKNKTKVIAHRGYWTCDGSAQNSIKSLEKAAEISVYGSEFDVHLTSDDVAVVYHDNSINNMNIQQVPYSKLRELKLSNGEVFPTLNDYLKKGKSIKKTKLIFELKSHGTPERDRVAAAQSIKMIRQNKLQKKTEYITFSLEAGKEMIRLDKKAKVAYLNGELSPVELKKLGFSGLDYHYKVMQAHPEWFKEAKELGLTVNVWTVNTPELMQEMINYGADFITTDHPEMLQQILKK